MSRADIIAEAVKQFEALPERRKAELRREFWEAEEAAKRQLNWRRPT